MTEDRATQIAAIVTTAGEYEESDANARLIASAPDMVAVLQTIAYSTSDTPAAVNGMRGLARAALAKAGL